MIANNIKTVIICSDFLATSIGEQNNNLRWLKDFLLRPISINGKLSVKIASRQFGEEFAFDRLHFFQLSRIEINEDEKQIFFNPSDITDQSISYLRDHFERSIVIGYELSESTRYLLEKAEITYIDIWLHPIRYLDDILFAFRSNNNTINQKLKRTEIPEETIHIYADRLRVQNYRGYKQFKNDLFPNSSLFVGQTLMDKAILSESGMLTLLDFKKDFSDACSKFDHVYYSRHPFVKSGDEKILSFVKSFRNVSLISKSSYQILSCDEIKKVFSISSSLVTEAKYFGKDVQYFFKPPFSIYNENGYYSVMHAFLSTSFWSYILFDEVRDPDLVVPFFDKKDKMRDALSWYWGYRDIDKIETIRSTVGSILALKK